MFAHKGQLLSFEVYRLSFLRIFHPDPANFHQDIGNLSIAVLEQQMKLQQKKESFPFWKFALLAQHQHCNCVIMLTLTLKSQILIESFKNGKWWFEVIMLLP